tara:strand:- start:9536 stop:9883 length:348 start_codon:yes stop_codon:yes gene_type:complete
MKTVCEYSWAAKRKKAVKRKPYRSLYIWVRLGSEEFPDLSPDRSKKLVIPSGDKEQRQESGKIGRFYTLYRVFFEENERKVSRKSAFLIGDRVSRWRLDFATTESQHNLYSLKSA